MATPASKRKKQAWSGSFASRWTRSCSVHGLGCFDTRLALHDIAGSLAHARMLAACGVIGARSRRRSSAASPRCAPRSAPASSPGRSKRGRTRQHRAPPDRTRGRRGKRLHTARSRNDQVATDVRLWLRDEIDDIASSCSPWRRLLARPRDMPRW
jgi:argininosuccinate lyase